MQTLDLQSHDGVVDLIVRILWFYWERTLIKCNLKRTAAICHYFPAHPAGIRDLYLRFISPPPWWRDEFYSPASPAVIKCWILIPASAGGNCGDRKTPRMPRYQRTTCSYIKSHLTKFYLNFIQWTVNWETEFIIRNIIIEKIKSRYLYFMGCF